MLKKFTPLFAVVLVLFLTLASVLRAEDGSPSARGIVTVIATTDFHGTLEPEVVKTASGETVEVGGAPLLAAYVKAIRAQAKGPVVHLDGGDMFQGSMASNLAEGAPVVRFFNFLQVTAAALGNHEFDYGPVGSRSVPRDPSDDPRGALKARIREARFPILAANVLDESGQTPSWLRRSFIYKKDGLRIGVVGIATPYTVSTTIGANLVGLRFLDPIEPVRREAEALRSQGRVDVVVLTFHGGAACADNSQAKVDDLSSCKDAEIFRLIKALPSGLIDVAVGGHTHMGVAKRVDKTLVLQSYSHGKQIGWAEVPVRVPGAMARIVGFASVCGGVVQGEAGRTCAPTEVRKSNGPVLPASFLGKPVVPDAATIDLLAPDLEKVRVLKEKPLGIRALNRIGYSYRYESALGNLVADVLRTSIPGAEIGVTNSGGLRSDVPAEELNYGHVFNVLPFDNHLAKLTVTGEQLQRMVELGASGGRHGSLNWSHLKFDADGCHVTAIEVNGVPLDPKAEYRVATNDYLASGGSDFDKLGIDLTKASILWDNIMRDEMAKRLTEWGKDIKSEYFLDPDAPRQRVRGRCEPAVR
jgi:5'-nucleotidase